MNYGKKGKINLKQKGNHVMYKIQSKIPKDKYDQIILDGKGTDELLQRELIIRAMQDIPFENIPLIRKISLLKINPFDKFPFNGTKPLLKSEIEYVDQLKIEEVILFEARILLTTDQNGTYQTQFKGKKYN